jgi:hypothetical protein
MYQWQEVAPAGILLYASCLHMLQHPRTSLPHPGSPVQDRENRPVWLVHISAVLWTDKGMVATNWDREAVAAVEKNHLTKLRNLGLLSC